MIEITIQGTNWNHVTHQMREMLGDAPGEKVADVTRASEANTPPETAQVAARRPGRPSNAEKAAAAKAVEPKVNGTAAAAEPEPEASRKGGHPSREDVVTALQTYADANGGQVAARDIMKKVANVTRLIDCPPDAYPKLIEALTGF